MTLADAIRDMYAQLRAPAWAAANLDALLDVLRDLSWLPEGEVGLEVPLVDGVDGERLRAALALAVAETAAGPRPVVLVSREHD